MGLLGGWGSQPVKDFDEPLLKLRATGAGLDERMSHACCAHEKAAATQMLEINRQFPRLRHSPYCSSRLLMWAFAISRTRASELIRSGGALGGVYIFWSCISFKLRIEASRRVRTVQTDRQQLLRAQQRLHPTGGQQEHQSRKPR